MNRVPTLRITLLLTVLLAACSLDPQPEPPMDDSFEGAGGSGLPTSDAATAEAGPGKGGQGTGGAAGSMEVPPDASAGADACSGDNCYCGTEEAGCDAGCETGEAGCDAACEGGEADPDAACDPDAGGSENDDAAEAGQADGALEPETGP